MSKRGTGKIKCSGFAPRLFQKTIKQRGAIGRKGEVQEQRVMAEAKEQSLLRTPSQPSSATATRHLVDTEPTREVHAVTRVGLLVGLRLIPGGVSASRASDQVFDIMRHVW